jgi:cysteine desulfurase
MNRNPPMSKQVATIYLDYAATTPIDPRVRDCMLASLDNTENFGNPSSTTHAFGRHAGAIVEQAAQQVAELINASAREIIWTSGATESDNLAILGAARFRRIRGNHIVTAATEHKAVLESCRQLEQEGFKLTYLQPDEQGVIAPELVAAALCDDTVLVSIMHANNEIGVVQDIAAIGAICRAADVLFHVDAAQSVGKLPIDVQAQQIDLLSLNAHKACGPKGVGALYLNAERIKRVEPLLFGGGQQQGVRPGTLAVHQIAGMGETLRILAAEMSAEVSRITKLRDRLWQGLAAMPGVRLNGHREQRLCSILNVSVAGVEGESLLYALSNLAVASGSACNSASGEPSYVLRSLGRSDQQAEASVRFSMGRFTTPEEIDVAIDTFGAAVGYLQDLSPLVVAQ